MSTTTRKQSSDANLTELIYSAYAEIGNLTPLKTDCGKLCGKICCKGDKAGMLLFPGEENIFCGVRGFRIEETEYMGISGLKLLLCDGECERTLRPLACRMFPAAPNIGKDGNVGIVPDIRGKRMCPIWDLKNADETFIGAVGKAFELLAKNDGVLFFMRLLSSEQDKLRRYYMLE
jgi:hypothetical protein